LPSESNLFLSLNYLVRVVAAAAGLAGVKTVAITRVTVDAGLSASTGLGVLEPGEYTVGTPVLLLAHTGTHSLFTGTVGGFVGGGAIEVVVETFVGFDSVASEDTGAGLGLGTTSVAAEVGDGTGGTHVALGSVAFVREFFEEGGGIVGVLVVGHADTSDLVTSGASGGNGSVGKDGAGRGGTSVVVVFDNIRDFDGGARHADSEASDVAAVGRTTHVAYPFTGASGAGFFEEAGGVSADSRVAFPHVVHTTTDGNFVVGASGDGDTSAGVDFFGDLYVEGVVDADAFALLFPGAGGIADDFGLVDSAGAVGACNVLLVAVVARGGGDHVARLEPVSGRAHVRVGLASGLASGGALTSSATGEGGGENGANGAFSDALNAFVGTTFSEVGFVETVDLSPEVMVGESFAVILAESSTVVTVLAPVVVLLLAGDVNNLGFGIDLVLADSVGDRLDDFSHGVAVRGDGIAVGLHGSNVATDTAVDILGEELTVGVVFEYAVVGTTGHGVSELDE